MVAVQSIFAHYVFHSTATFEETPPTVEAMTAYRRSVAERGLPFLVATHGDAIAGFSYASTFRPRPGYRYTVEEAIYLSPDQLRKGIGSRLLAEVIRRCERGSWRQMIAVIGDSANAASIALHERLGFRRAGLLPNIGFKLGRWTDVVLMQRALGPGDATPPPNDQA